MRNTRRKGEKTSELTYIQKSLNFGLPTAIPLAKLLGRYKTLGVSGENTTECIRDGVESSDIYCVTIRDGEGVDMLR